MKFNLFALILGLSLIPGLLPASHVSKRQNALIQPFFTAIKAGDLKTFATYAKIRRITDFEHLTDVNGMNPLHMAAALGRMDFIRYLIMHGASVNATTSKGFTPLQLAAFNGKTEAAKCLVLEGNCQVNKATPASYTAMDFARTQKNSELAQFLAKYQHAKIKRFAIKFPRNFMAQAK